MAVADIFRGKALYPIDAKDRVSVPIEYRAMILARARRLINQDGFDAMADDTDERRRTGKIIVASRDTKRGCLVCFDNAYARDLQATIEARHADKVGIDREQAIHADSAVFAGFQDLAWDVNGRIVLPQRYRQKVGIGRLALFLAIGKTFEIWDPAAARAHFADNDDIADFIDDELAARGDAA